MAGLLNRILGDKGERQAAKFLRRQGYKILARQSSGRVGEIDLIALDGQTIVFVEVKTRRSTVAGHPVEAITPVKQRKLTAVALAYLKRHGLLERRARFDVISLIWSADSRLPEIEHYRNAFEPTGIGQMFS